MDIVFTFLDDGFKLDHDKTKNKPFDNVSLFFKFDVLYKSYKDCKFSKLILDYTLYKCKLIEIIIDGNGNNLPNDFLNDIFNRDLSSLTKVKIYNSSLNIQMLYDKLKLNCSCLRQIIINDIDLI